MPGLAEITSDAKDKAGRSAGERVSNVEGVLIESSEVAVCW